MHKRFIKYIAAALMLAVWTMGAQNPAGRPKRQSEPTSHTLRPDTLIAQASPYRAGKNFGKRIAVFGGSLSVNRESESISLPRFVSSVQMPIRRRFPPISRRRKTAVPIMEYRCWTSIIFRA
jgi:hypothetical protein